ncbi:MAG TPA: hypothetical protein VET23_12560 [Chitinophagaceae bacterium]|nr:hypothetical protein [Chitinophagaceae bacterium]
MKDTKSLLLLLLSAGLIGTWVYHLYDKNSYTRHPKEIFLKDSAAIADGVRDSLVKIYSQTINNLDSRLDSSISSSDSTRSQLGTKLTEIYKLKNEIGAILKNRRATKADLIVARNKIAELEKKVQELRDENMSMEEERKQLTNTLDQLTSQVKTLEQNIRQVSDENKDLKEKINLASTFIASEINFSAITTRGSREIETSLVRKTKKFVISFSIQNNVKQDSSAKIYLVILQPDGNIFRNGVWDSGTFETRNNEKKEFSALINFDYIKGELNKQIFSLDADKINQPGIYTLQIWHNGIMIGQAEKKLK